MGGAAGGALQTGQRIGASIGAALLVTAYQLTAARYDPDTAFRVSLAVGAVLLGLALAMAVRAVRHPGGTAPAIVSASPRA